MTARPETKPAALTAGTTAHHYNYVGMLTASLTLLALLALLAAGTGFMCMLVLVCVYADADCTGVRSGRKSSSLGTNRRPSVAHARLPR